MFYAVARLFVHDKLLRTTQNMRVERLVLLFRSFNTRIRVIRLL